MTERSSKDQSLVRPGTYQNPNLLSSSSLPAFISGAHSSGHRASRSTSSFGKLHKKTSSNESPHSIHELRSMKNLDYLPSGKPAVTFLDRLWTQIDVLDDVKALAEQVKSRGSFFNDKFNEDLLSLRQLQNDVLELMARLHVDNLISNDHQRKMAEMSQAHDDSHDSEEADEKEENRLRAQILHDFFEEERTDYKNILHKKQNYDDLNSSVEKIKKTLLNLGQSMKDFDGNVNELL